MKLRYKVLAGITLIWLAYLIITYVGSREFLIKNTLELEHDRANSDLTRIDHALEQIKSSLSTFTSDWAHWNDMYDYMEGHNPAFISNNINVTALLNSTINFLSYWDVNGKLVIGKGVDIQNGRYTSLPHGLEQYLYPGSELLTSLNADKALNGYLSLPDGIMMISASALSDGNKLKKPVGTLVTGRYITKEIIRKIQDITKLNIDLYSLENVLPEPDLLTIFNNISRNETGHFIQYLNETTLAGYSIIRDINDRPIGMFRMTTPRVIYQSGQQAIRYYLMTFIALGVFFAFLFIGLLRVLIVKRLERLNEDLVGITRNNQFNGRVDSSGTDELAKVSNKINQMMEIIQASHAELESRVEKRTTELQLTNEKLQKEILDRKSIENELIVHKEYLARLAHYDGLTSLPNRMYFNEQLEKMLKYSAKNNKKLAVMFIDLDRFKNINDALGHHMGDLVLKEVANRINSVLRVEDILARLGGDEFIILLNDIESMQFSSSISERILQAVTKPITINDHEFFLSASIGICLYPDDGNAPEDLQRNADMAMYKAKQSGGNLYQYYSREMNDTANEHIKLEASLRRAIKHNEFVLHYQPKHDVNSCDIIGVEALIRWEHPDHGMISPAKFIPHAEESGLIMQIGEWVMREACRACKSWHVRGYKPISVAVNISPKQFRHQEITQLISSVLSETQLDPQYLELEITESAVMDDVESATNKLIDIQSMGVKISIDDFGSGYTSIGYLKRFPVSVLKIDQQFIKGLPENHNDIAITEAVIELAHSMGMKVVAEGVESTEQLKWLTEHDCDMIQGYLLSRPQPENSLLLALAKTNEEITTEFATGTA